MAECVRTAPSWHILYRPGQHWTWRVRSSAGFADAQHAEYDAYASVLFITPLSCSMAGRTMTVHINDGTAAAAAYRSATASECYYCNFGLNPAFLDTIIEAGLSLSGTDADGEPRILELPSHPFFVATLFVPQISSEPGRPHPFLVALLAAGTKTRTFNTNAGDTV